MKRIKIATQLLAGVLASPNLDNNKPTSLIVETVLEFADELIKQCPEESEKEYEPKKRLVREDGLIKQYNEFYECEKCAYHNNLCPYGKYYYDICPDFVKANIAPKQTVTPENCRSISVDEVQKDIPGVAIIDEKAEKEQEMQCVNCVHYKICKEYDIEGITCSDYQRSNKEL